MKGLSGWMILPQSRHGKNWAYKMHSQYNILPFNTMQYNVTDAIDLTFHETVTSSDARANMPTLPKVDSLIATDVLSKQITDKRLSDAVQMNIWFTEKNNPQSDPWG